MPKTDWYRAHGDLTDPGRHVSDIDSLPDDVNALCAVVAGVLIHDWARDVLYGPMPAERAAAPRHTLSVADRIDAIKDLSPSPLGTARPPELRSTGTCRDFSLLLCCFLRQKGLAARVRCGFATYFVPEHFEDHWICEYRCDTTGTWKRADAQLDDAHRRYLGIRFDPADLPGAVFLTADDVWQACRSGALDAHRCGHGADTGMWFVWINRERDRLALDKQETSAWDNWRMVPAEARELGAGELERYDWQAVLDA